MASKFIAAACHGDLLEAEGVFFSLAGRIFNVEIRKISCLLVMKRKLLK